MSDLPAAPPPVAMAGSSSVRRLFATAIAFSAAINLLYFAAPLYLVQIFTRVLSSRSVETLVALSVIVLVCIAATAVLESARAVVVRRAGEAADAALSEAAFARTMRSGGRDGLADLDRRARLLASPSLVALLDLPWILVFVVVLGLLHPWLGALALVGVLLLTGLALTAARLRARQGRAAAGAEAAHADVLRGWSGREALARAIGIEGLLARRWGPSRARMLQAQSAAAESQAVLGSAGRGLRLACQCAAIGIGAALVLQDAIGTGAMFAANLLIARALAPVEAGIGGLLDLRAARACAGRLAKPAAATAPAWRIGQAEATGLQVERLTVRTAATGDLALAGIGIALHPGEKLGIVGPSGSGKSLLLACLAGAVPATTGSLRFANPQGVRNHPPSIGYLPQMPVPIDGTLQDAVGRGRYGHDDVADALAALDLGSLAEGWPDGPDTRLERIAATLPMGVRQRLGIARAICGAPDLVLLDEPTAHLDSDGERALLEAIASLKAGGTVVIVASHRPSVLGLADRLLVLDGGRERMSGPRNEILSRLARKAIQPVPDRDAARA